MVHVPTASPRASAAPTSYLSTATVSDQIIATNFTPQPSFPPSPAQTVIEAGAQHMDLITVPNTSSSECSWRVKLLRIAS